MTSAGARPASSSAACDVLVVGGGATGTGLARDLAMRGLRVMLVEQGDLAHGTTGRYHGLLHSGGRYVVRDPPSARDCAAENRILRDRLSQAAGDVGSYWYSAWTAAGRPELK